jgi:hypothetical protein
MDEHDRAAIARAPFHDVNGLARDAHVGMTRARRQLSFDERRQAHASERPLRGLPIVAVVAHATTATTTGLAIIGRTAAIAILVLVTATAASASAAFAAATRRTTAEAAGTRTAAEATATTAEPTGTRATAARTSGTAIATATASEAAAGATTEATGTRAAGAAEATTATRTARLALARFVDAKHAAVELLAVELLQRLRRGFRCRHLDEREPARASRGVVANQVYRLDLAVAGEELLELRLLGVIRQIPYVDSHALASAKGWKQRAWEVWKRAGN